MKRFQVVVLLLISSFLFSNSAPAQQAKEVPLVAVVGNKTITLAEFNKRYADVKAQAINAPTKEQFLEDLVRYEVGLQEAEKRKMQNDPIVQERLQQEMYKALVEKDLGASVQKIHVTEKDMTSYYEKNPEIRTSHILIEVKAGSNAEQKQVAKKRAQEIFEEVKKSKRSFEELVKLYSDDPAAKQTGGDIGWQTRLTLVPAYYETALRMKMGDVAGLIETPFGFHIIKLTGKKAYASADKRAVRTAAFDEKRREIFNDYFEKMKKNYKIQLNKKAIE